MWSIEKESTWPLLRVTCLTNLLEFFEGRNYMGKEVCCYFQRLFMSSLNSCEIRWKFLAFVNN